jgi:sugar-phosphatase
VSACLIPADALLLDMDGVLVDSTATVEDHWTRWARRRKLPVADIMRFAHGSPTRATVARFVPTGEVAAETDWMEALAVDGDGDVALPGAAAALSQRNVPVAVVTSATRRLAQLRLQRAGLAVPDVLVGADDVPRGKPHPAPYLRAAMLLGVQPGRCVGVEDSPVGLASLRAAGVARIAVLTTHAAHELDALGHLPDLRSLTIEAGRIGWTCAQ